MIKIGQTTVSIKQARLCQLTTSILKTKNASSYYFTHDALKFAKIKVQQLKGLLTVSLI